MMEDWGWAHVDWKAYKWLSSDLANSRKVWASSNSCLICLVVSASFLALRRCLGDGISNLSSVIWTLDSIDSAFDFRKDQWLKFWFLRMNALHVDTPITGLPPQFFGTESAALSYPQVNPTDVQIDNAFYLSPLVAITKHATINTLVARKLFACAYIMDINSCLLHSFQGGWKEKLSLS